jgi:hypothetical protein
MARLTDHGSIVQAAQQAEEAADAPRIERERGGKLQQQRPERITEPADLAEEPRQRLPRTDERAFVCDQLGDLDGEAERRRHSGGPALIGRGGVRTVER